MRQTLSIPVDLYDRLRKIANVHHRSVEEQILWYLELAIDIEWQESGAEIMAKLAQRTANIEAYWDERPEEAREIGRRKREQPHA